MRVALQGLAGAETCARCFALDLFVPPPFDGTMAQSFAAYASQFLNRQQQPEASISSSQPLFFSFTTDNGDNRGREYDQDRARLDDLDDPHIRMSEEEQAERNHGHNVREEDEDPYLRLDEDGEGGHESHRLLNSHHDQVNPGWLAHASPLRSPSPLSTPSRSSEDTNTPPPETTLPPSHPKSHYHQQAPQPAQPPPPPRTAISLSLTESLLPRDGQTRPVDVFNLPDPRHYARGRRKYNDSIWTSIWLASIGVCLFFSIVLLFVTHKPRSSPPSSHSRLPYTTLLHTVPLLTIITFLSALVFYVHIFLLKVFVAPVVIATSAFIPVTLFISALWAFIGSFMWDGDQEPTWGETVGLRLFSIVPLVLSLLTARRLLHLPRTIHTTSSLLTLTTRILILNPYLLALSPLILLISLLASIPFLTVIFRLLLVGYFSSTDLEWHVRGWANWAMAGTVAVWLWSWGAARGVLRCTTAGVVGAWYYSDPAMPPPPPTSTHTIHSALLRSTHPSLGTVVLSALILTLIRLLLLLSTILRRLPVYLPIQLKPLAFGLSVLAGYLEGWTGGLSRYGLVYVGLTGEPFWIGARRAGGLVGAGRGGGLGKRWRSEPSLSLLTVAPLTLTFPSALTTYLFVAHTLGAPDSALRAAVLSGGVTALVGLFCVGLVKDTADTLYMCYCIDKDCGEMKREEVFEAFEYEIRTNRQAGSGRTPAHRHAPSRHVEPEAQPIYDLPPSPESEPEVLFEAPRQPLDERIDHQHSVVDEPEDMDPFLNDEVPPTAGRPDPHLASAQQSYYEPKGSHDLETGLDGSHRSKKEEEEGEESQIFPGSDFF